MSDNYRCRVYRSEKFYQKQEENLKEAERKKKFNEEFISIPEGSKKMFGNSSTLYKFINKPTYNFLPITRINKKLYFNRGEFMAFWDMQTNRSRLIKLGQIIAHLGLKNNQLLYLVLENYGFYKEVNFVKICKDGKKYYFLADVNKWLRKNNLNRIVI